MAALRRERDALAALLNPGQDVELSEKDDLAPYSEPPRTSLRRRRTPSAMSRSPRFWPMSCGSSTNCVAIMRLPDRAMGGCASLS